MGSSSLVRISGREVKSYRIALPASFLTSPRSKGAAGRSPCEAPGRSTRVDPPGIHAAARRIERRGTVRLEEAAAPLGVAQGLDCSAILINSQSFTKTANIWGVANNRLGTNSNRIVLFRKA